MKKVFMIIAVAAILVGCKGKGTRVQISDSVDKFKVEKLFVVDSIKECGRCKHFNGMFAGRCTKLHKYVESSDWCHGTFFHRK